MNKDDIIKKFKNDMDACGGKKAIIGISGGKDSTVVAMLAIKALGRENVLGILMPDGDQRDVNDSYKIVKCLGLDAREINIKGLTSNTIDLVRSATGMGVSDVTKINTPTRMRMVMLYAIAGSIPGGRVINTSNASEAYVGYCTKWGDTCGDVYPLIDLLCSEVMELGEELAEEFELPYELIAKTPSDGTSGKTDEQNFGFTYEDLDNYLRGKMVDNLSNYRIACMHKKSLHKFTKVVSKYINGPIKN